MTITHQPALQSLPPSAVPANELDGRRPGPIRVFLVDDHAIVRAGARLVLGGMAGFALCGEADRAAGVPEAAAASFADVLVVDLDLGGELRGLEVVAACRAALPQARILVYSMNSEDLFAERALRAGANGYVVKDGDLARLEQALLCVVSGQVHLSERMKRKLEAPRGSAASGEGPIASLTDRELQIFLRLGAGRSTHQIAEELRLSMKTVSAHRENLKAKLGVTGAELVQRAVAYHVSPHSDG